MQTAILTGHPFSNGRTEAGGEEGRKRREGKGERSGRSEGGRDGHDGDGTATTII